MDRATEVEALRAALARREEQLAEAQQLTHIGSWDWEVATNSVTWSDELYRIFGLSPQEFGATFEAYLERIHPDERTHVAAIIAEMIERRSEFEHRARIVRPDGEIRILHSRGRAVADASGAVAKLFGTCRDITEEQRLHEQMLRLQRMDAVGRLAGGIAHDFNNLLTVIMSYCELIQRRSADRRYVDGAIAEVLGAASSAAELSRQLLTFARGDVVALAVLDPREVIASNHALLRRLAGETVTVELELASDLGRIRFGRSQLEQVLVNLTVNARDAMPGGGRLRIVARDVARAGTETLPPGSYVVLQVSDDGVGMPAEVVARAFEPFFTTKPAGQGTGLGLSTVYGIVRQAGGDVAITSAPGAGTSVEVFLPRTDATPSRSIEATPSLPGGQGERLVVVEDNARLRALMNTVLSEAGYRVRLAGDGAGAHQLLADRERRPALLITDVVLPGQSGEDVALEARELHPDLPILYMSGYPRGDRARTPELGPRTHFLSKPFTPAELLNAVVAAIADPG